jgi:hypothetical protein
MNEGLDQNILEGNHMGEKSAATAQEVSYEDIHKQFEILKKTDTVIDLFMMQHPSFRNYEGEKQTEGIAEQEDGTFVASRIARCKEDGVLRELQLVFRKQEDGTGWISTWETKDLEEE